MATPVVVVASGGLPVVVSTNGFGVPMTIATNGYGRAITQSTTGIGLPVVGVTFGPDVTAPIITSSNAVSNVENTVLAHALTANEAVTWAIVAGGADNARFELSGSTLRWLSNGVKDFEAPNDADANNTYVVTVRATDTAANPSTTQTITVTVTNVTTGVVPAAPVLDLTSDATDNTPDFTLTGDLALNDTVRFQYGTASDFTGASDLTNAIDAGEDAANTINFSTGALANGTWYFRARVERPGAEGADVSDWSNVESVTITASAWTPASLPNLVAWFKADVGVCSDAGGTIPATNGQVVKVWKDQSGNNYHLLEIGGAGGVIYRTNQLNSLPVLDNDGTMNLAIETNSVSFGGTVASAFVVVKWTAAGVSSPRIISVGASSDDVSTAGFTMFQNASLTDARTYSGGYLGTATMPSGAFAEVGTIFDGTNNTMYINNVAGTPVAATPTFAATVGLGVTCTCGNGVEPLTGQIAEVVLTKSAMTVGDRASLSTYFTTRWGV